MNISVLSLRPTQFALGMREVETKVSHLMSLTHEDLQKYLEAHRVPVVAASGGEFYLIDHHHLARACWESGIMEVKAEKKADLSHLGERDFWKQLQVEGWIYLHDQFGKGPHAPELLPFDVKGMADDPFRSLAWELRQAKGYTKVDRPFSEFRWADFLRKHITIHPSRLGLSQALKLAMELCHHPEAKSLPGYLP